MVHSNGLVESLTKRLFTKGLRGRETHRDRQHPKVITPGLGLKGQGAQLGDRREMQ